MDAPASAADGVGLRYLLAQLLGGGPPSAEALARRDAGQYADNPQLDPAAIDARYAASRGGGNTVQAPTTQPSSNSDDANSVVSAAEPVPSVTTSALSRPGGGRPAARPTPVTGDDNPQAQLHGGDNNPLQDRSVGAVLGGNPASSHIDGNALLTSLLALAGTTAVNRPGGNAPAIPDGDQFNLLPNDVRPSVGGPVDAAALPGANRAQLPPPTGDGSPKQLPGPTEKTLPPDLQQGPSNAQDIGPPQAAAKPDASLSVDASNKSGMKSFSVGGKTYKLDAGGIVYAEDGTALGKATQVFQPKQLAQMKKLGVIARAVK